MSHRSHFYNDEAELMLRLRVLRSLVTEQDLHGQPCQLLRSQLSDLVTFADKLTSLARKARDKVGAIIDGDA